MYPDTTKWRVAIFETVAKARTKKITRPYSILHFSAPFIFSKVFFHILSVTLKKYPIIEKMSNKFN